MYVERQVVGSLLSPELYPERPFASSDQGDCE
jgi:hypothetical protein